MKVFKKDGMLSKPAEEHVRLWHGNKRVGEPFTASIHIANWAYIKYNFRFMGDGSIQAFESTSGEWIECAKSLGSR